MNFSFVLLGLGTSFGALVMYQRWPKNQATPIGFWLLALSGIGVMLAGIWPENTNGFIHIFGAGLAFILGNLSLVFLSQATVLSKTWRIYTLFSGLVGLLALVLLVTQHYLGLGAGALERIVDYPRVIWLIVTGFYTLRTELKLPAA